MIKPTKKPVKTAEAKKTIQFQSTFCIFEVKEAVEVIMVDGDHQAHAGRGPCGVSNINILNIEN